MSSQVRSDRRDRSSRPSVQNNRQQWVPRGGVPVPASSSGSVVEPPRRFQKKLNGNGGDSNQTPAPPEGGYGGRYGASRGHSGRWWDRKKEKGKKEMTEVREVTVEKESSLPQLVQEIQEKLMKGTVECMICYDMVRRSAPVWSCSSCYSIFHLSCTKKWARAPTSVDISAERNQGLNWRCPGCQSVQLTPSKDICYVCFCGKRQDPPSDMYLTPHSCGEPCGKPLEKEGPGGNNSHSSGKETLCPHSCVLQCHPGPCPPCKAFAPPRLCPCGKKIITTRCSDRKSVLTCGQRCDKLLDCWRHRCERICHLGPCDPCQVLIDASCFCQKRLEVLQCGDIPMKGEVKAEDGVFSCDFVCGKKLHCSNHICAENCHPGPCGECELIPSRIKTCCCGKTSLQEERKSCLDPIATCQEICGKPLPCGIHYCRDKCHTNQCAPCLVLVTEKCRCGLTSRTVECYKTTTLEDKFTCDKQCGRKKNCGRHRCSERCCPLSNSNGMSGDWVAHVCSMVCGKKLRCGQHACESPCHSGHCPPCLETIFTELTCACRRTSIPPPSPCGTPLPSCQFPCLVPRACSHPSAHSCHFGDCPPCSAPIAKECVGGHVVLRNIPCGSKGIRCNKLCGKTRQCGLHACARTCHPAPCDPSCGMNSGTRASCGQTCGAPRRDCRHTCTAPCHPSAICPDERCAFPVTITCSCGRISANVPCDAGGSTANYNADSLYEVSIIQNLPVPLQPLESNGKKIPLGQRKLSCNEECAKFERKRVLADAFDITPPNLDALHFGESSTVSEVLVDLFRRDPKWVLSVEERCKFLVLGKNRACANSLKVHVFCSMLKEKRYAIRLIADRWKLLVNSAGWEPKRFVVVHATSKSKAPARLLGPKGAVSMSAMSPPVFDPLIDMDPRLVVSFLDLPRDADISALVLRFGGECELVWLNDKNALAVFSDPARAATAMRRLDHGSVYHGAVVFLQNPSASASSGAPKGNPWKKAIVQEPGWSEDSSWGPEQRGSADVQANVWQSKKAPIASSVNRWKALDTTGLDSSLASETSAIKDLGVENESHSENESHTLFKLEATASSSISAAGTEVGKTVDETDVVEDWEQACEQE